MHPTPTKKYPEPGSPGGPSSSTFYVMQRLHLKFSLFKSMATGYVVWCRKRCSELKQEQKTFLVTKTDKKQASTLLFMLKLRNHFRYPLVTSYSCITLLLPVFRHYIDEIDSNLNITINFVSNTITEKTT